MNAAKADDLAKLACCEVIACASSAAKLERLQSLGADHLLDYTQHKLTDWVFEKYGKPHRRFYTRGVDVVVNFTGGDTWVPSLRILHRQGRMLTCGATAGFTSQIAHAGGPPFQIYVLPRRLPRDTFIGTSAIFFMSASKLLP